MNWIKGQLLYTHTCCCVFQGTYKGRLCFDYCGIELIFSAKDVNEMIGLTEWTRL